MLKIIAVTTNTTVGKRALLHFHVSGTCLVQLSTYNLPLNLLQLQQTHDTPALFL